MLQGTDLLKNAKLFSKVLFCLFIFLSGAFSLAEDNDNEVSAAIENTELFNELAIKLADKIEERLSQKQDAEPRSNKESDENKFTFEYPIRVRPSSIGLDSTEGEILIDEIDQGTYVQMMEKIIERLESSGTSPLASDIDLGLYKAILSNSIKLKTANYEDKSATYNRQKNIEVNKAVHNVAKKRETSALKLALNEFDRLNKADGLLILEKQDFESIRNDMRELLVIAVIYENLKFKEKTFAKRAEEAREVAQKDFNIGMQHIYGELSQLVLNKFKMGLELVARSVGDDSAFMYSTNTGFTGFVKKYIPGMKERLSVNKLANHFWLALISRHDHQKSYQRTFDNMNGLFHQYEVEFAKKGLTRRFLLNAGIYTVTGVIIGYGVYPEFLVNLYPESLKETVEVITYFTTSLSEQYVPVLELHDIERANVGTITGAVSWALYKAVALIYGSVFNKTKTFINTQNKDRKDLVKEMVEQLKSVNKRLRLEAMGTKLGEKVKQYPVLKNICVKLLSIK